MGIGSLFIYGSAETDDFGLVHLISLTLVPEDDSDWSSISQYLKRKQW